MENTNFKIKPVVSRQLPEFVREDHTTLVAFLEAYYEWLEGSYGVISPEKIGDIADVDSTVDAFIDAFRAQYLKHFPKTLSTLSNMDSVSVQNLVKNASQFYRAKGSEASFKFLFRVVFGVDVETYLPKTDILVASGSAYIQQTSIKITNTIGNDIFKAAGRKITQIDLTTQTNKATARCERVITYREGKYDIAELFLAGIQGTFESGFPIRFVDVNGTTHTEQSTYSLIQGVTITNPGTGYSVGDSVVISGSNGLGAVGEVSRVGSLGEVKAVRMLNFGVNYKSSDGAIAVEFVRSAGARGQLLKNPSFEDTSFIFGDDISFTSPVVILSEGDTQIRGWEIIKRIGVRVDNPFTYDPEHPPYDGIYLISLIGTDENNLGGVAQTIETVPGVEYNVAFHSCVSTEATILGDVTRTVRVSAGLDSQDFNVSVTADQTDTVWSRHEFTFTATSTSTRIKFENATEIDSIFDFFFAPLLDGTSVVASENDTATGTVNLGPIARYDGFYNSESGHLSTNKVLQDNVFYQPYSYVLKSEVVIDRYKNVVKNLVHPAGFAFFGAVQIIRCFESTLKDSNVVENFTYPVIGNYTPYTLSTFRSLDDIWRGGYLSPFTGGILSSGDSPDGFPFWEIYPHPNLQNVDGVVRLVRFGDIVLGDFIEQAGGYLHECSEIPESDYLVLD